MVFRIFLHKAPAPFVQPRTLFLQEFNVKKTTPTMVAGISVTTTTAAVICTYFYTLVQHKTKTSAINSTRTRMPYV